MIMRFPSRVCTNLRTAVHGGLPAILITCDTVVGTATDPCMNLHTARIQYSVQVTMICFVGVLIYAECSRVTYVGYTHVFQ